MNDLPWIAGIRAFEDEIRADPINEWKAAIRNWGYELCDDGTLREHHRARGAEVGRWALTLGESRELTAVDCPFVGPRLGSVAFELFSSSGDETDRHELICGLLKEGRDGFFHRPSGRAWSATRLLAQRLSSCLHKWGFDDGALLLTRNQGAYSSAVAQIIENTLRAGGHEPNFHWLSTCHNPWRADDDRAFANLSASFWLYDFDALTEMVSDPTLW